MSGDLFDVAALDHDGFGLPGGPRLLRTVEPAADGAAAWAQAVQTMLTEPQPAEVRISITHRVHGRYERVAGEWVATLWTPTLRNRCPDAPVEGDQVVVACGACGEWLVAGNDGEWENGTPVHVLCPNT